MTTSKPVKQANSSEYHVASFVAHAKADQLAEVQKFISDTPRAEIHATSPEGKIVFTLEGVSHKDLGIRIDHLKDHLGILNLSPVYHQYVSEETEQTEQNKTNNL